MSSTLKELLDSRPDVKEQYYKSVPYPRHECPVCGNPIHQGTYKDINKDVVCNLCDQVSLKDFIFIERR